MSAEHFSGVPPALNHPVNEILKRYILSLSHSELIKILTPVKARLITEDTLLHLNTLNFSVDYITKPLTVRELLNFLKPTWRQWIHSTSQKYPADEQHGEYAGEVRGDMFGSTRASTPSLVEEFIKGLTPRQTKALVTLIREGILTNDTFLNMNNFTGPDRVEISLHKVIQCIADKEVRQTSNEQHKSLILRILLMHHFSSGNFERMKKSDLDVTNLSSGREKLSVWYTLAFILTTGGTVASHIWCNAVNFELMQAQLSITIAVLVISSMAVGGLLYLATFIMAFLFCCENSMSNTGLEKYAASRTNSVTEFLGEMHHGTTRIWITKILLFCLMWYTLLLTMYSHENGLNIYPAIISIVTNSFGLIVFDTISRFLKSCRTSTNGKTLYAR